MTGSLAYTQGWGNKIPAGQKKIWDAQSGKIISDWKGAAKRMLSANFSPEGKYIVTASQKTTIKIWLTRQGVMDLLSSANIYNLTQEDLIDLGVDFIDLKKITNI